MKRAIRCLHGTMCLSDCRIMGVVACLIWNDFCLSFSVCLYFLSRTWETAKRTTRPTNTDADGVFLVSVDV